MTVQRSRSLVLLVDDSPTQSRRASLALEAAGFRVQLASNGREALEKARHWRPNVIVSDILMPVMDGFTLCREVRRDDIVCDVPVVLHTLTFVDSKDEEFALALGATSFVLKPSDPADLVDEVRRALSSGHVQNQSTPTVDNEAFLQGYSERLAAKLEEKVTELEDANQLLEQRVRDRTAELEAAVHELEAFSYSVSHDLRAPLRAMDGFSRMLVERFGDEFSDDARGYLERIRGSAQRMSQLIDDLLAFARLSRKPLTRTTVRPGELVKEILEELEPERQGRRIEERVGILPSCQADPSLLKQVYVNLLQNAFKFTRNQDVAQIDIGFSKTDDGVVYHVKDNGAGFDMQYADKLFGVFQRLHRPTEFEGTGVGLATCQRIIHRHGGRIWADAAPDRGASFYFTIGTE
jgi:two-component system, sensor histidine kinase and response regulator